MPKNATRGKGKGEGREGIEDVPLSRPERRDHSIGKRSSKLARYLGKFATHHKAPILPHVLSLDDLDTSFDQERHPRGRDVSELEPQARERIEVFLSARANGFGVLDALAGAELVGWSAWTKLKRAFPGLQRVYDACSETGEDFRREIRRDAAHQRAVEGWLEPVFYKGQRVGYKARFSPQLLQLLMQGDDPEKYSPHKVVEHQHTVDAGPSLADVMDEIRRDGRWKPDGYVDAEFEDDHATKARPQLTERSEPKGKEA